MYYYCRRKLPAYILSLIIVLQFVSCKTTAPTGDNTKRINLIGTLDNIIPKPVSQNLTGGMFTLNAGFNVYMEPMNSETDFIGHYLADKMKLSTGCDVAVLEAKEIPHNGNIYLTTKGSNPSLGDEGYELIITENLVTLTAFKPAGLFRGIQTLRQILPQSVENKIIKSFPIQIPTCIIRDHPRFSWRGVMLDVARHFFIVDDVKKLIDIIAYYKINRFHLHLTDDQGWRIEINSWPNLALHGGSTEVGGGPSGYYTQSEFSEIVKYAKDRYIMVVPEVDMPGHTNAALSSYAELNCDGNSPPLYTGIDVGFSTLCTSKDSTYIFIDDVIREITKLSPDPYLHIGGDEASVTELTDYVDFIERVQKIVHMNGKQMIGWEEIAHTNLKFGSIVQCWRNDSLSQTGARHGAKLIMSPSTRVYMDMKYDSLTMLGQNWAGYIKVSDSYNWDPASHITGITESDILGVEAPLWTETITNFNALEYMFFPRLPGIAEIGWSSTKGRNWEEYKVRLTEHGSQWKENGLNFYRSPEIRWK
jgi:hexosaminidase